MKKQFLITALALAVIATGCSSVTTENAESSDNAQLEISVAAPEETSEDKTTEESTEETMEEASEETTEEALTEASKPSGKYVRTDTDEIEGQEVSLECYYEFNDDGTGTASFQDTVSFTWDEKNIKLDYGDTREYKLDGDTLSVKEQFGWEDYTKK